MLGNNVPRYKLTGFIIGSAIAGVAGGLQAHTVLIISPPMIEVNRMIEFMAMGIIGGLRTIGGGIFGAVIVFGLSEGLRDLRGSQTCHLGRALGRRNDLLPGRARWEFT